MSDEFPLGGEGNSFHAKAGKRDFSLPRQNEFQSLQSSTTSTVAETTTGGAGAAGAAGASGAAGAAGSAAGVGAGAITAGTVTAGVVVTGVVVLAPSVITTLPTVQDLSTEVTSSTISYAFTASYVSSGKLYVKLSDASTSQENTFDLAVAESASSVTSSGDSTSTSSSGDSSGASSSSAVTYLLPIQGKFNSLKEGTAYTLTVATNLTSSTQTTLSTVSLQTTKETVMPTASLATPSLDYDKASLSYTFTLSDPSSVLDKTSLYSELVGYDTNKAKITRDTPFAGNAGDPVSLSLADFMKGNYLRLSLYGKLTSSAANDEAMSLGEIALYY
jgi:hypothetical protein